MRCLLPALNIAEYYLLYNTKDRHPMFITSTKRNNVCLAYKDYFVIEMGI